MVNLSLNRLSLRLVIVLLQLGAGCRAFTPLWHGHFSLSTTSSYTTIDYHSLSSSNTIHSPSSISNNFRIFQDKTSKRILKSSLSQRYALPCSDILDAVVSHDIIISSSLPSSLSSLLLSSSTFLLGQQQQEPSLLLLLLSWKSFWIVSGSWNLIISSVLCLQPTILNTRDGGITNPDLQTAIVVGVFGALYTSFAFDDTLVNLPWLGYMIPFAAILKIYVTPWLYENGCLSVPATRTISQSSSSLSDNSINILQQQSQEEETNSGDDAIIHDLKKNNGKRQQISPQEVNLWRFIAAGDACFAIVFIYYFIQHIVVPATMQS